MALVQPNPEESQWGAWDESQTRKMATPLCPDGDDDDDPISGTVEGCARCYEGFY